MPSGTPGRSTWWFYSGRSGCTSRDNHHLHGERADRKRGASSFEFFASLFADDCAVLFESHDDMVVGMDYLYKHFMRFGLEIHLGRGSTASKTEAMFFPKPRCDDGSTPPNFNCADGFISYTRMSSTWAVTLSLVSIQRLRFRSASRRRVRHLVPSLRVHSATRTSVKNSRAGFTSRWSCRSFSMVAKHGFCAKRNTI